MRSKRNKRVVVAVDLARPDGQRRLEGLMRFLQSRKVHWDLRIKRSIPECTSRQVDDFPAWDIDGVIYAQPQQDSTARNALNHLVALDIPLVVLDPGDALTPLPKRKNLAVIRTDPDSIGEIATQCFLSQGVCRSYGYVPDVLDRSWSRKRGEAFAKSLRHHGADCHLHFQPPDERRPHQRRYGHLRTVRADRRVDRLDGAERKGGGEGRSCCHDADGV